jgi:hypothetical protein
MFPHTFLAAHSSSASLATELFQEKITSDAAIQPLLPTIMCGPIQLMLDIDEYIADILFMLCSTPEPIGPKDSTR